MLTSASSTLGAHLALRTVLRRAAGALEEMPLHPEVAELVHEMARAARAAAEDAARSLPTEATWEEPPAPPNR